MFGLILLAAIVSSAILQLILRGGPAASGQAPVAMRRWVTLLLPLGMAISVAPLFPLLLDVTGVGSGQQLVFLFAFLLFTLAMILPAWIWIFIVSRGTTTRSISAFALSASAVNTAVALCMYRGLLSGVADDQDGIVVQIVPLMQLSITASSALLRRALDKSAGGVTIAGSKAPKGSASSDS